MYIYIYICIQHPFLSPAWGSGPAWLGCQGALVVWCVFFRPEKHLFLGSEELHDATKCKTKTSRQPDFLRINNFFWRINWFLLKFWRTSMMRIFLQATLYLGNYWSYCSPTYTTLNLFLNLWVWVTICVEFWGNFLVPKTVPGRTPSCPPLGWQVDRGFGTGSITRPRSEEMIGTWNTQAQKRTIFKGNWIAGF